MDPNQPESTGTTKKWLIGCGIGCGAVILIVGVLIVGGVFFVKDLVEGFEESEAIRETLTERYGRVTDFTPAADGAIPRDRMIGFLEVRDRMRPALERLEKDIAFLSDEVANRGDPDARRGGVLSKVRTGFGLVPKLAEFLTARNQALLDGGMGLGEYFYIYAVAYYSWLGKDVLDGPPFNLVGDEGGYRYRDRSDEESEEMRRDLMTRRLHRMLSAMLKNQRDAAAAAGPAGSQEWLDALNAEIEAMDADRYRLVWEDGLPEVIIKSLDPFRARLNDSYRPLLNTLEITLDQR